MSLAKCLKKIAINKPDKKSVDEILDGLVQDGMTQEEINSAESQAVEQYLSSIDTDLDNMAIRAESLGGTIAKSDTTELSKKGEKVYDEITRRPEKIDERKARQAIIDQAKARDDAQSLSEFNRAKKGEEVTFTHRSFEDFTTFDDSLLGSNTTTPSGNLGHYLSAADIANADRYGSEVSVHQFSFKNPLVISAETFESVMSDLSVKEVMERRKALMDLGHDGILVEELNWAIAFESSTLTKLKDDAALLLEQDSQTLVETEYQGTIAKEKTEWEQATEKFGKEGMTKEARLERAKEMGFDTSTVFIHDTSYRMNREDIGSIKKIETGEDRTMFDGLFSESDEYYDGLEGDNIFFVKNHLSHGKFDEIFNSNIKESRNKVEAEIYDYGELNEDHKELIDDLITEDKDNLYDLTDNYDALPIWISDLFGQTNVGLIEWEIQRIRGNIAKEFGYDAVDMYDETGTSTLLLATSGVRNINAAFDPDKADSSNLLYQDGKTIDRGSFTPLGVKPFSEESIIKLTKSSDLSSFLHESAHLFLDMEARFASVSSETSKDQQTILDFLGMKSFNDLIIEETGVSDKQREAHEKWAETFEVYLREGKAPSSDLQAAFAAFKSWLIQIYRSLSDPRLSRADLTPEIKEVFDRLLASEVEIDQMLADPAYDQFFKSKEQAGMTDKQWSDYNEQAEKARNRSQESLDSKLIKELYRRKTKEWDEEKKPIIQEELERLKNEPVYQLIDSLKEAPMNRAEVREALGMSKKASKEERAQAAKVIDTENDSLLVAAARSGGLDMSVWSKQGVDPENLKKTETFNNKQVFGMPVFKKDSGLTPDGLAELANENGYGIDLTANKVLDLVYQELNGEPVYTPEGIAKRQEADYREKFGEEKKTPAIERMINRITKKDGIDPYEYQELYDFGTIEQMFQSLIDAKPIKKAAVEAAEQKMIDNHGDILNDGSIELEVRESIHNEEQAKLVLAELRALNKKAPKINRERMKNQAKELVYEMQFNEIQPSKFYRAELKAAKLSVSDSDNAYQHKLQQLANHYMYKEAVKVKDQMVKQRKYVRKLQTKKYSKNVVHPSYSSNIRMLANAYNMKQSQSKNDSVEKIINWMVTQVNDENNFIDFDVYDPTLIKAIQDTEMGLPISYELPSFDSMTAGEMKGLSDQLKHMRYIGGRLASGNKEALVESRIRSADSIVKNGGKEKPPTHEESVWHKRMEWVKGFIYSHRRIGGIFQTLDGFEVGGPMSEQYEIINKATNKQLELTSNISKAMDEAFKDVLTLINRRRSTTITKGDGKPFKLYNRERFVLALNWGNEGNRKVVIDGLNNTFDDVYTKSDVMKMLSTMSDQEIMALDKIWEAKEPLWPEMSGVEVRLKGIVPSKVEASPFTINGIEVKGGHYRLHYRKDPDDSSRSRVTAEKAFGDKIKISTASSLNERVGSGGRQVDLELSNLFQDLTEDIHYIAYAEMADSMNSMFKGVNNPVVGSIIKHYGHSYYENLVESISAITQPSQDLNLVYRFLKQVRSNLTYAYLAFSVRNIVQQPIAITNTFAQLGVGYTMKGAFDFYKNPKNNKQSIINQSEFMKNRTALVNREAREQLMKIDSIHPKLGAMKNMAFLPQTFMDSLIAYPTWMGAKEKYLNDNPLANEKEANAFADEMVAKTIGSGLTKDVGSILNQGEAMKQITFMGTFFNLTWNLHVENAQLLKRGKISGMEYARRVGWMAIVPAILSMFLLDDVPEDDEKKVAHALKEVAAYNMSSLFLLRDLASTAKGFTPSIPGFKVFEGTVRVTKEMKGLMTGDEDFDAGTVASILRGLQPLAPLPGSGQAARMLEGSEDPKQGVWGMLVEGKERNK